MPSKAQCQAIGNLDPSSMNLDLFKQLIEEYGENIMKGMSTEIMEALARPARGIGRLGEVPDRIARGC